MVHDLDDERAGTVFEASDKIACSVRDASWCEWMNLVQSIGKPGLQDVFHFHFQTVPKFSGDRILLEEYDTLASKDELSKIAQKIRSILGGKL